MTWYLYKGRHIERKALHDDGVRNWSDAATNQGMPKVISNLQMLGERPGWFLPQSIQKELALPIP